MKIKIHEINSVLADKTTFAVRLTKTENLPKVLSVVTTTLAALYLQGDSVEKVTILGGESISIIVRKESLQ